MSFRNLPELIKHFESEETCKSYLEKQRWGVNVICPHCNHTKVYRTNRGYKCASPACYKKFTVISGTIYEGTKIPLSKWFPAVYLCTAHKKGISSIQLGKDIGVTQKTAWFMLHRIRLMMSDKHADMLEGTTEVDETYVGGKRGNKHKHLREKTNAGGTVEKTPVVAMLNRDTKQVHNFVVVKTDSDTLKPLIYGAINTNSVVITDSYPSYKGLSKDYKHETVNHRDEEYVRGDYHTNTVEGYFSLLKRGIIGIYHYVSPKHLHRYCNEFGYRYNTRKITDSARFEHALQQAKDKRVTWNNLTAKKTEIN